LRILAIDVGTTSAKAAVVDDGTIVEVTEAPVDLSHPFPGWAEQDPDGWWTAVVTAARSLRTAGDVVAVVATGQMQDLVPVRGEPGAASSVVRPAILYSDQRAVAEHEELSALLGDEWGRAALAQPDSTNVAAKWQWLRRHEPTSAEAADVVLFGGAAYIVWRATGAATSDPTVAATTGLADVRSTAWWRPVVDAVGIPLPAIVGASDVAGNVSAAAAAELGVRAGLPVVHACGDAVATSIGVLGDATDAPYAYLGTSGWVGVFRPAPEPRPGVIVLPGASSERWLSVMPVATAGGAADWARETLLGDIDIATFDRLAGSACAASDGVGFLSQLDGTRFPTPDPFATGVLVGMRRSTGRSTVAAAVYEGVAQVLAAIADVVVGDGQAGSKSGLAVCGGGARSDVWCQVIADVTGRTVRRVSDDHASLRGAASCAQVALGGSPVGAATTLAVFEPRAERAAAHRAMGALLTDLASSLAPGFAELARIRAGQTER
jgi:xylulokinase